MAPVLAEFKKVIAITAILAESGKRSKPLSENREDIIYNICFWFCFVLYLPVVELLQ